MITRFFSTLLFVLVAHCIVAQDLCVDATDEGELGCGESITVTFDMGDTPDPEAVGCMIGLDGTWYIFTVNPLVTEFEIVGGTYELFEGADCSSLNPISDCGSPDTFTPDPATTYFILVNDNATVQTANFSNDECDNATNAGSINCGDVLTASGDPLACSDPEATGCMTGLGGVWYEFTTEPTLSSFDISGSNFELFSGSCGSLTSLSDCGSTSTIMADDSETYYILVEGSVTITAEPNPFNDVCGSAEDINSGSATSTCCGVIEGIDQCGGASSGVWFTYSPGADGVAISFSNVDLSGSIGFEIYSGDCSGLVLEDSYCGGPTDLDFEIPACSDQIYIHVTSEAGNCGSFSVSASDIIGCSAAESCDDATDPLSPSSGGGQVCFTSCTQFSCDGVCAATGVWFLIETDDVASYMEVIVNNANFDPVVTIYQGDDCGSLTGLVACETPNVGEPVPAAVNAMQTYYVEVGAETGIGGDFDLCVLTDIAQVQCSEGDIEPTRPEYPDEDPFGPYCPGETVNFCYEVDFTVDPIGQGNNCQWIQGIIPTIGGGWDLSITPIDDQGPDGGWFWLDEGNVDHNVDSPVLELINTPNGLGLAYGNGGLSAGDLLPGGWWYTSPGGGSGCTNDGDPDTMWGLPASCGSGSTVEFCFNLTVRELSDPADCGDMDFTDLKVHIFTMADGQTGCWSNNSCAGDVPVVFDALMDCTSIVEVLAEGTEICSGEAVDILVEAEDGSAEIFVEVVEEGNTSGAENWMFTGTGVIPDVIVNDGTDVEVVIYEAYALSPPSVCKGPILEIEVVVYPEIYIEAEDPYYLCYGQENEIEPGIFGGTGGPYDVQWSNGATGTIIVLPEDPETPPGEYELTLTVTDDLGCTGEETIQYEIIEPVEPVIFGLIDFACKDGVDDMVTFTLDFVDVGTGPYDFQWDSNPVGLDFLGTSQDVSVIIDDENSATRDYTIFGTVIDDFGCEYTTETSFTIDNGPELEMHIAECFGSGYLLEGYNIDADAITFELYYDEDGSWDMTYPSLASEELVFGPFFGNTMSYWAENFGNYILVGTSQNGCQDFFILEVPPLAMPIFEATPNDTVCAGTTVTIKVANADLFVEFDWSTGSDVDSIVVTPTDTTTYYLEAELDNGCEVIDSVQIVVNPLPLINITGSTSFCAGSFTTLTAQGPLTSDYVWTDPMGVRYMDQTIQANQAGTWLIQITSSEGCVSVGSVDLVEDTQLDPQIIGGNFCSGEDVTLDGGPGFDSYTWFDITEIELGTDPQLTVSSAGSYILEVFLGNCSGRDTFDVEEIQPLPDALSADNVDLCNIATGSLPTSVDLTSFLNPGITGNWFNENGIPVMDPTNVDFDGAQPGSLNYSFETTGAVAPCENDIYDFTITVNDCACPSTEIGTPPNFCIGVDTFDLDLIKITTETGVWSVTPADLEILNNEFLIVSAAANAGSYDLTYTLDGNNIPPTCPTSATVSFDINALPVAEIMENADVCNLDTGNGPDFIDLDDLYISGSTGVWSTNEPGITIDPDNVVSFTNAAVGNYTFFYLTDDALAPCQNITYTSTISVRDCSCPQLDLTTLDALCSGGAGYDLNDYLINPENEPGNWTISGPDNTVLIGSNIDPADAPSGIYTVTFAFNTPPGGSCVESISGDFEMYDPPFAMTTGPVSVCNGTNLTTFPTSIDLTTLIIGDDGFWTAPADFNNGIIDDETNVDFIGVEPGIYQFVYTTTTAIAPCTDLSIVLNLEVVNCNCPIIAFNTPSPLCNNGDDYNLNGLVAPGTGEGTWSFIGGATFLTISEDSVINVNGVDEGLYVFEYILSEMPPAGCIESSQITLEIYEDPQITVTPSVSVCNTQSIQGPICIDFTSLSSGAAGVWTPPVDYTGDFSDTTNVCFEGLPIGSTYEFVFLTNTAVTPCTDKRLSTIVTVIDCSCPNLSISEPDPICNDRGTLDLSTLEDPNIADGSWTVSDGPQAINLNGTIFNASGVSAGTYTLEYIPDEAPPMDCPESSQVTLEVVTPPNTGSAEEYRTCEGQDEVVDLFSLLAGEDSGGDWAEISQTSSTGNAFNNSGEFNTTGQVAGIYEFEYSFTSIEPCEDVSSIVTIVVERLPTAEAGDSKTLSCEETVVSLDGTGSSGSSLSYMWTADAGINISNPNTPTINVEEAGIYTLQVTDGITGCISFDQVEVTADTEVPEFGTVTESSPCFGLNAGSIIISSVQGGDGNYIYSIDNGLTWSDQTVFGNLAPGTYSVIVEDGNGCQAVESGITISEPDPLTVDTGEDREIEYGDEFYTLMVDPSIDPSQIESVTWTENGVVICSGTFAECGTIQVDPELVGEYCATVVDINGCTEEDCVVLRERIVRDVYIPNIFNPNDFGSNSAFYVNADQFVVSVDEFLIFDRWGEKVFEAETPHEPNNIAFGWEGDFNDSPAEQGVYVYRIKVTYDNGETELFIGDITLIR